MPLVKRPGNPYFWYDFRFGGRRYRGSTKQTSKAGALAFESRLISRLEAGEVQPGKRSPLLRDFIPQFLESFDANQYRAEATKRYYKAGAKLLLDTSLRDVPLDRITTPLVAAIRFPNSAATANNAIRTLSRTLRHAQECGFLRHSPRLHLHPEVGRELTFSPDQESRLLAFASQPLADVFVILLDTGMRPEEVYRLRWEDVDWAENVLRVHRGKTKAAQRVIGMSSRVADVLRGRLRRQMAMKKYAESMWVFPSRRKKQGELTHITTVNKAFAIARNKAQLPQNLVLYATRHTFGTDVMAATGSAKLTMKSMGHVDVKTSVRYQHPETRQIASIIDVRNAQRKSATIHNNGHTFGHTGQVIQ